MATIKAIESRSVHQIQSGQVIVDLNSVAKELVENSLDAGATSIEIRFKNYGLDSIEVQDNGKGIAPEDFETLALKHYTSKLASYEDLDSLETFGFRGEALSSLCALSRFHVLTARAEDGAVGKKLDFETSGKLKSTSVAAAQKGTTVYAEDIFFNLPVRRKELEKNIKREFAKVTSLLYQYACISTGVRFAVSNQIPKGKKTVICSTKSNATTKDNIANVFGAKTLMALVRLDLHLEMDPSMGPSTQGARVWSTQTTDTSSMVHVEGHVSKPIFGEGRQAPDRQMFFVNGRPCLLPQIAKAFNEVYKGFNVSQSPFVFANLKMDTNAYDVNVSPDKRTIMLHDQAALLESLKSALSALFERTDHTVPQSTLPNRKLPSYQPLTISRRESTDDINPKEQGDGGVIEESDDEEVEANPRRSSFQGIVTAGEQKSPNLMHDWVGRDTELRKESRRSNGAPGKGKQKLIDDMRQKYPAPVAPMTSGGTQDTPDLADKTSHSPSRQEFDAVHNPDPLGTPFGDLFSQRPPLGNLSVNGSESPNVSDEQLDQQDDLFLESSPPPESDVALQRTQPIQHPDNTLDAPIPAVAPSSQKATPGPVQSAFERMRPKRTPLQTAEITVGDVKMTTTIGTSPPFKKRRMHKPDDPQRVASFGASPSLAHGLRKSFAAPGSRLAAQNNRENDREEDTEMLQSEHDDDDALEASIPVPADEDECDEDYLDEDEKKTREEERVSQLIAKAEATSARPTEDNLKRAAQALKNGGNRKGSTLQLARQVQTSASEIEAHIDHLKSRLCEAELMLCNADGESPLVKGELASEEAESRLSLTVTKTDFARMQIVGQFNVGFILAIRPSQGEEQEDDLFIIDQHAADEKYNYERLQRTVILQSQRLVRPKPLELTATEEEVIINNQDALKANGFEVEVTSSIADTAELVPTGRRCRLLTLPMSKEKTFDLSDLEELLHLLSETPAGSTDAPRPKKVQHMLAMRACRSSIMVGKTLTTSQMRKVVDHMGEMEKPWNCPHGRPTMRHLAGLRAWNGWQEGDVIDAEETNAASNAQKGRKTDWKAWLRDRNRVRAE